MISANHGFHDIAIHPSGALVRRYAEIVVVNVAFGKSNLKKVCSQSDRPSHRSKIGSFGGSEVSTDAICCKDRITMVKLLKAVTILDLRKKKDKLKI